MSASTEIIDAFFTNLCKEYTIRSMNLTNMVPLDGQANYDSWASTMSATWRSMGLYELVVDGIKPSPNDGLEEQKSYKVLYSQAVATYIQVVKPDLIQNLLDKEDPHLMWTHLVSQYKRDTAYALVYQVGSLCELKSLYNPSMKLSTFIQSFESEWSKLYKLARDPTDSYRHKFASFLEEDSAKRDFLLGLLSRHKRNVVDNLTNKSDLTYAGVKQRLIDLDYEETTHTAFSTSAKERKNSPSFKSGRIKKKSNCTYCKKKFPNQSHDHTWFKCPKIKEKNLQKARQLISSEEAHITSSSSRTNDSTALLTVPAL